MNNRREATLLGAFGLIPRYQINQPYEEISMFQDIRAPKQSRDRRRVDSPLEAETGEPAPTADSPALANLTDRRHPEQRPATILVPKELETVEPTVIVP